MGLNGQKVTGKKVTGHKVTNLIEKKNGKKPIYRIKSQNEFGIFEYTCIYNRKIKKKYFLFITYINF